jgi:class 3 adenylate cyclase/HAMP domain-containing protein
MSVRVKIVLVVLPLIIVTLLLAGLASYFSAVNGITRITREFFTFKAYELEKYTGNQWALLMENDYAGRPEMVAAAESAVELYARSIVQSESEVIFALGNDGALLMSSSGLVLPPGDGENLLRLLEEKDGELFDAKIAGKERVVQGFYFAPFQRWLVLSAERDVFYQDVKRITVQTIVLIAAASAAAVLLLFIFSRILTKPLVSVVDAMNGIIRTRDLSSRVEAAYNDETGQLANTFNIMTGELDKAYNQIKRYAFDAVLSQKKEQRIRRIFQKYVPRDVIDEYFANPDKMLVGKNEEVAILFSDIRSFTAISESIGDPKDLVDSLNRYFSGQVDIIMNRRGIVDKYIGDAIMAVWGAPRKYQDDALQSVLSGLDMLDALESFNARQKELNRPEFRIGVGINYGLVTVGNIGSERKMDYTVIGDMVNLASRMEGLTKTYHSELLISESLYNELARIRENGGGPEARQLRFRLLDTVAVKGKTKGVKIFTVNRSLRENEETAWTIHNEGMDFYYTRSFKEAEEKFRKVLQLLPGDFNAESLAARCAAYAENPPPEVWDGVEVMKTK